MGTSPRERFFFDALPRQTRTTTRFTSIAESMDARWVQTYPAHMSCFWGAQAASLQFAAACREMGRSMTIVTVRPFTGSRRAADCCRLAAHSACAQGRLCAPQTVLRARALVFALIFFISFGITRAHPVAQGRLEIEIFPDKIQAQARISTEEAL